MHVRSTIVAAAVTHVGNVRDHNEDSHLVDAEEGVFIVCDGMGGHAAGEVASAIGVKVTREHWLGTATQKAAAAWAREGTLEARRHLLSAVKAGVMAAHRTICEQSQADLAKKGMGTTFTGVVVAGGDAVIAHAGDSRAYLVRGGIAMQLTEDHTLLARLMAAGLPMTEGADHQRWKGVITNALGFGDDTRVITFTVPLSDGDRLLLCSDGVSEYIGEHEIGEVLLGQPSPGRAAQHLIDLALARGGEDNATALVIKVLEAGESSVSAAQRQRDAEVLGLCPLLEDLSPQQRLRALRIATGHDFVAGDQIPEATLHSRVAWILLDGEVVLRGDTENAGALLYPEALLNVGAARKADALAVAVGDVRALAVRGDDFAELCAEDADLAEPMYTSLAKVIAPAT